jgi:hypothetical protein
MHLINSDQVRIYALIAALVTFWLLLSIPTKMKPHENVIGSFILAVAFGWLLWPMALIALIRSKRR